MISCLGVSPRRARQRVEVAPVRRVVEEPGGQVGSALEVVDRLEQRDDLDEARRPVVAPARAGRGAVEPRLLHQQQHLEHVAHAVGHRDHVRPDALGLARHRLAHHLQHAEQLARGIAERAALRAQRARARELGFQHRDALLLVHVGVPIRHAPRREQLADRLRVHLAVLADVERREVEPERARAHDRVGEQPVLGGLAQPDRAERPAEQQQVVEQARRVVGRAPVRVPLDLGHHLADAVAERLELEQLARALREPPRGEALVRLLDPLEQLGGRVGAPRRDAELASQAFELFEPERARGAAQGLERVPRDLRGHIRVPVPVAPDPRPVGQDPGQIAQGEGGVARRARVAVRGADEVAHEGRDRLPDGGAQVVQAVADLLGDLEPARAHIVGHEQHRDDPAQAVLEVGALAGEQVGPPELADAPRDLELLVEDRPPAGLGRVGGQRGLDPQAREHAGQVIRARAHRAQAEHGLVERLGAGCLGCRARLALPVDLRDRQLLGLVEQVEPRRDQAEDIELRALVERRDAGRGLVVGRVVERVPRLRAQVVEFLGDRGGAAHVRFAHGLLEHPVQQHGVFGVHAPIIGARTDRRTGPPRGRRPAESPVGGGPRNHRSAEARDGAPLSPPSGSSGRGRRPAGRGPCRP
jgi:hypothetical protein